MYAIYIILHLEHVQNSGSLINCFEVNVHTSTKRLHVVNMSYVVPKCKNEAAS